MPRRFHITRIIRPRTAGNEPLKVALVLSGAVALGSFEAGVIYELMSAIARGAPLTIDILVGSSAGSLVASMVAKSLVMGVPFEHVLPKWTEFTLTELTSTYESAEDAWQRKKPLDKGFLSSEAVRRILDKYLVKDPVQRTFQPRYPAPRVVLTVTLTNLDGLPGTGLPDDETRFAEAVTFRFSLPDPEHVAGSPYPPAVWQRIAQIGRASAAFPGAFDPGSIPWIDRLRIPGLLEELWENDPLLEKLHSLDPTIQPKMRYADGGILDEQPVERGISILPLVTGGPGEAGLETLVYDPRRCLLFIEPDPPATSLDALKAGTPQPWFTTFTRAIRLWTLSASPHTSERRVQANNRRQEALFRFLADLARRMREESQAPTLLHARHQFGLAFPEVAAMARREIAQGLADAPGLVDPVVYQQSIREFYHWLIDDRRFGSDLEWLDRRPPGRLSGMHRAMRAALLELRDAYLSLEGADPAAPDRYQKVLEEVHASLAQNLGLSQPWVALHQITPEDPSKMLKGEGIAHFGGFFSKEFLLHDFEVGRYYAYLWLKDAIPDGLPEQPPVRPPFTEEGLDWRLIWQNRTPLARMVSRLAVGLLEAVGFSYDGTGQLLVRLLTWSLLLSVAHGVLLLVSAWVGWITFPPQYQQFRFWLLLGTSIFPLTFGLILGLLLRSDSAAKLVRQVLSFFRGRKWGGGNSD